MRRFATGRSSCWNLGFIKEGRCAFGGIFFPLGQIFGVDLNPPAINDTVRIHVTAGDASDPGVYARIERQTGVGSFDIIIDDASHLGVLTKQTFAHLFPRRLNPGGLYVIEDWGTGYRGGWPDGSPMQPHADIATGRTPQMEFRSHQNGMVGLVKQLIDHVACADVQAGGARFDGFDVDYATIAPGLCFLKKRGVAT